MTSSVATETKVRTRTQASSWTFATALISTGVTVATGFLTTPLLLRWLGAERFGAFRAIVDCMSYLTLLDLGLGGAVLATLAPAVGRRDSVEAREVISTALREYVKVALVSCVAGLALVSVLPRMVPGAEFSSTEVRIAGCLLLGGVVTLPLIVFRSVLEASQQGYLVNAIVLAQSLLATAMLLVTARAGFGLAGQAASTVLAQCAAVFAMTYVARPHSRGAYRPPISTSAAKRLWRMNWSMLIYNLSGRLAYMSDNLVIACGLGASRVAPFYITQRLLFLAQSQLQNIGNASWAGLVELYAQGRVLPFRARVLELTRTISGVGLAVAGPLLAYNHHFVVRWVGASNFAGNLVTCLAALNCWFMAIFSFWGWLIAGTGNIDKWTRFAALIAVLNLSVSLVATLTVGIAGPLIGTCVSFLIVESWAYPSVLSSCFELGLVELWAAALQPFLWAAPYIALLVIVNRIHEPRTWAALLLELACAVVVGMLNWWTFSLTAAERATWKARVALVCASH